MHLLTYYFNSILLMMAFFIQDLRLSKCCFPFLPMYQNRHTKLTLHDGYQVWHSLSVLDN